MKRNWLTTGIGIIIILGSVISVLIGKADWTSAGLGITAGSGFILSKDYDK